MGTTVVFVLFGNKEQSPEITNCKEHYFYFGFNIFLPSLHNVYIAAILFVILLSIHITL